MKIRRLPGVIDVHVHLRDPGATQKEDFTSGGRAAIAGGVVYMLDMPNNPIPTVTKQCLDDKVKRSKEMSRCPIGFHYGTDGKNEETFSYIWANPNVFGLKIYCNQTTGPLLVQDEISLERIFTAWSSEKPILVHALGEELERVLFLAQKTNRWLHVCHMTVKDLPLVIKAKKTYKRLSIGVTPHHLFLTESDKEKLGTCASMLPPLDSDNASLWKGLHDGVIDLVESDHAPHTRKEKESDHPPFGVPGLESTLGLLLQSVHEKKMTIEDLIQWTYTAPKKIFTIPVSKKTYIELDPDEPYKLGQYGYKTKCGWSPFHNWELYGRVQKVVIEGNQVL